MERAPENAVEKEFLGYEPSRADKLEIKLTSKKPSQWLKLLCKEWSNENISLLPIIDANFLQYKSYLRGQLSSQLLCRVSYCEGFSSEKDPYKQNFWKMLGVKDDFDCSYISSQVERFCSLYGLRSHAEEENQFISTSTLSSTDKTYTATAHDGTKTMESSTLPPVTNEVGNNSTIMPYVPDSYASTPVIPVASMYPSVTNLEKNTTYIDPTTAALAISSSALPRQDKKGKTSPTASRKLTIKEFTKEPQEAKSRARDAAREEAHFERVDEKAAREASREERRRLKVEIREIREQKVQTDKEAALQRAAELVQSNCVPIEITGGAAAATAAVNAVVNANSTKPVEIKIKAPEKRTRSSIVVSTAHDLQQIVTHSRNLWEKYNAIAKQHNQKVSWITIAKELGIHVKVREKYARMYSRAEQRGFDFDSYGHYKMKDYPNIFLYPTVSEGAKRDDSVETSAKRQKPSKQIIQRQILENMIPGTIGLCKALQNTQQTYSSSCNSETINTPKRNAVKVEGTVIPGTIDEYNILQNAQELSLSSSSNSDTANSPKSPQHSIEPVVTPVISLEQK